MEKEYNTNQNTEHEDLIDTPEQTPEQISTNVDPFTRMMFGVNRPQRNLDNQVTNVPTNESTHGTSQQTDFTQYYSLMQQVDDIIGSVERMKPMLKEITPLLDFFKKWK
ncbi:hypothetical protein [Bacillus sp. PS06]|uniref:hypothetical protein n=1 Tax=Bacillus sp. PS06 TaxID=2764176 RepID=UPI00177D52DE|nr:hypothetical protein [Bacillus sp. PS06]MBD8067545.1 hypothetical protein [Bacillus sp. PS06]